MCVCIMLVSHDVDEDFEDITMSLEFPANSPANTERCATFSIFDDNTVEFMEEFTVTARGATFDQGQDSAVVIIQDNDGN